MGWEMYRNVSMRDRDFNLDFVKGVLVIVMVVYHAMNYFAIVVAEYYGYLRFINGAFIFISGYVVSTLYDKKYQTNKEQMYVRLVVRGLKLLALFTVLNLLVSALGVTSYQDVDFGLSQYWSHLGEIYGFGNGKLMAFQILVPISYVLLISPIFFIFQKFKIVLIVSTLLLAVFYTHLKLDAPNLFLGMIGLVGVAVGMLGAKSNFYTVNNWFILLFSMVISASVMNYLSGNVLTYSLGILVVLKLIYDSASLIDMKKPLFRMTILMGQYSLICYIGQIVFLYALYRLLSMPKWPLGYEIILVIVAATLFLVCVCLALAYLRPRYRWVDNAYKVIFA